MRGRFASAALAGIALLATIAPAAAQTPRFRERAATMEVEGVRIPAAVTLPAQGARASAVLLIPGSLFSDVDGNYPVYNWRPHAYADLARQLAARGHVVLRFAKVGPGTGSVVVDSQRARVIGTFAGREVVAQAALRMLRADPAAAGLPVFLAGHSEGAVVASLLAASTPGIRGVVGLSGPSVGLLSIMREQLPPGEHPVFEATVAAIRSGAPLPEEAARAPQTAMLAAMDADGLRYMRDVDAVDPAAALARVTVPVLLVQGGRDASVRPHHAQALARARGTRPTETAFFPELQHFYKRVAADADPMTAMQVETESDPAVADAVDRWIRAKLPTR